MQIKIFGEDIGILIFQRSLRRECRHVLRMYLEQGNRKLLTLEAHFSSSLFSSLHVIFILYPYQLFYYSVYVIKDGPTTFSISPPFKRPGQTWISWPQVQIPRSWPRLSQEEILSSVSQSRTGIQIRLLGLLLGQTWVFPGKGSSYLLSRHCKCLLQSRVKWCGWGKEVGSQRKELSEFCLDWC